MMTHYTDQFN